ncbi:SulP family inorganic anion transporter [Candidatus Thiothrix sp. Deng01]|uniref:SulP family inorganic anion transporter n=1 Tax=Candidatus Thiothrix phosphatis TaxID=3112415 RepID=A0ABU6D2K6_9GAMM|nr:SulP family inorganic anion transporter [Candidatus Thiothrix sp. Deng01]MEB4593320.1 SulP family inorganic anion transporter [Candidatus Thiothrix sp. Deng01]
MVTTAQPIPAFWSWLLPFLNWLPKVNGRDLRADLIAGLTGAIVVLPQGVAFATIAGMPPQYGLYAGMAPAVIAALFGSSRHLVSGPTTAASVVLFSALSVHAAPGSAEYVTLALTLTFMVGVFELALGLARMGALVNFISHSVVIGFTAGAAILIAAKQLKHFFGVDMENNGRLTEILFNFWQHLDGVNLYATSVAAITLLTGIAAKKWLKRLPYMVVSILAGSLASIGLNAWLGSDVTHIATVGALPNTFPPLSAPELTLENIKDLAPAALAVTLFALTEAVSIGRAMAARGGYNINGNQEFIGQGLSNLAGAFFSGYVSTGSFNRTGVNYEAGARTPMAAIFAGVMLMFVVVLVAPFAAYLPKAAMAGVLFLVSWGLIDWHEIHAIVKFSRRETVVLAVTFFGSLFLDLEFAIFAGVMLSLVLYLEKVSKPKIITRTPDRNLPNRSFSSEPDLPQCRQLRFLRIDGSLFFGSVNHLEETFEKIRAETPEQTHLAIICDGINFADLQGSHALYKEAKIRQYTMGGHLYLVNVKEGLWDALEACECFDNEGARNVFQSKAAAIHAIYQKLDKSQCEGCTARIFKECDQHGH